MRLYIANDHLPEELTYNKAEVQMILKASERAGR